MKVLIFLALILISCNTAIHGQDDEKSPLKLTIKLETKQICNEDSLKLAVWMKNVSENSVIVDTTMINTRTIGSWSGRTAKGFVGVGTSSISHSGRPAKPNFIVLNPGESYETDTKYKVEAHDIVASIKYTLKIGYGQTSRSVFEELEVWRGFVYSNDVSVSVEPCQQS